MTNPKLYENLTRLYHAAEQGDLTGARKTNREFTADCKETFPHLRLTSPEQTLFDTARNNCLNALGGDLEPGERAVFLAEAQRRIAQIREMAEQNHTIGNGDQK